MRDRLLRCIAVLLALALFLPGLAHAWLLNKDVRQAFVNPQDNFEVCFKGNFLSVPTNKGIIAPKGWPKTVQKSYDAAKNETCFSFAGPPLKQQPRGRTVHFGIGVGIVMKSVKESNEYWTRSVTASATAGGSCGFSYNAATSTVVAVLSNDSNVPQVYSQLGYWVLDSEPPLAALNRDTMPPASATPAGMPSGTTLFPGETFTFAVSGVQPSQSFVCTFTAAFSDPEPGGYDDVVTLWTSEVAGAPEGELGGN